MFRKITRLLFYFCAFVPVSGQVEERINSLNEMAFMALEKYDYRKAIDLEFSAVEVLHEAGWNDDTVEIQLLSNIGSFYHLFQKYDSAVFYLEKALDKCRKRLGTHNEVFIGVGIQLGGLYEAVLDLRSADGLNGELLQEVEKQGLEGTVDHAFILNNQAIVKHKLGQEIKALELITECLAVMERLFGKKSVDYAGALNARSMIYAAMGKINEAGNDIGEAEKICNAVKDNKSNTYAAVLGNKGTLFSEKGDYKNALLAYEKSHKVKQAIYGDFSLESALMYANKAVALGNMGELAKGLEMYDRSIEITSVLLGPLSPDLFQRKSMKAWFLFESGVVKEAENIYVEMLKEAAVIQEENPADYFALLVNAAQFYSSTLQYDKADAFFYTLQGSRNLMDDYTRRRFENNYAGYLHAIGKDDEAERIYLRLSGEIGEQLGRDHPEYALSLQNIAVFYQDRGSIDTAEYLLKAAGELALSLSGPENKVYLRSRENLAENYYSRGRYGEALHIYDELAMACERRIGRNNLDFSGYLSRKAMCLNNLSRVDESLVFLKEAYSIKKVMLGERDPQLAYETILLATAYTYRSDFSKGNEYFAKAKMLMVEQFNTFFRFMTEDEKLIFLQRNLSSLRQLQAIAIDVMEKNPSASGMVMDIELVTKGMILESGHKLRRAARSSADPEIRAVFGEWNGLGQQLAKELVKPETERRKDLPQLQQKAQQLEKVLITGLGDHDVLRIEQLSWKKVADQLQEGEALVEFIVYSRFPDESVSGYAAVILKKGVSLPLVQPLCTEQDLQRLLTPGSSGNRQITAAGLYSRGAGEAYPGAVPEQTDYALYQLIWSSLEPHLRGSRKVYYSPGGALHKISFSAIPVPEGGFLSDRHQLVCLSAGKMLSGKSAAPFEVVSAFVAGGINYQADLPVSRFGGQEDKKAGREMATGNGAVEWPYLEGTLKEAEGLKHFFDGKKIQTLYLTGDSAYEEKIKEIISARQPSLIHIATHGYFFPDAEAQHNLGQGCSYRISDNPMLRSGLVLTGANRAWTGRGPAGNREDGILTAFEVAHLDLSGTRLVVLSACETGLGDIQGSEGVFGLQRAFKQAGAEYIIMSLWQVPDRETVEFMDAFYKELLSGTYIEQAFINAQEIMKKKYEPYYWAAFVLVR
jgi:hypothetical protein